MKVNFKITFFCVYAQLLILHHVEAKMENILADFVFQDESSKVTVSPFNFIFIRVRLYCNHIYRHAF